MSWKHDELLTSQGCRATAPSGLQPSSVAKFDDQQQRLLPAIPSPLCVAQGAGCFAAVASVWPSSKLPQNTLMASAPLLEHLGQPPAGRLLLLFPAPAAAAGPCSSLRLRLVEQGAEARAGEGEGEGKGTPPGLVQSHAVALVKIPSVSGGGAAAAQSSPSLAARSPLRCVCSHMQLGVHQQVVALCAGGCAGAGGNPALVGAPFAGGVCSIRGRSICRWMCSIVEGSMLRWVWGIGGVLYVWVGAEVQVGVQRKQVCVQGKRRK